MWNIWRENNKGGLTDAQMISLEEIILANKGLNAAATKIHSILSVDFDFAREKVEEAAEQAKTERLALQEHGELIWQTITMNVDSLPRENPCMEIEGPKVESEYDRVVAKYGIHIHDWLKATYDDLNAPERGIYHNNKGPYGYQEQIDKLKALRPDSWANYCSQHLPFTTSSMSEELKAHTLGEDFNFKDVRPVGESISISTKTPGDHVKLLESITEGVEPIQTRHYMTFDKSKQNRPSDRSFPEAIEKARGKLDPTVIRPPVPGFEDESSKFKTKNPTGHTLEELDRMILDKGSATWGNHLTNINMLTRGYLESIMTATLIWPEGSKKDGVRWRVKWLLEEMGNAYGMEVHPDDIPSVQDMTKRFVNSLNEKVRVLTLNFYKNYLTTPGLRPDAVAHLKESIAFLEMPLDDRRAAALAEKTYGIKPSEYEQHFSRIAKATGIDIEDALEKQAEIDATIERENPADLPITELDRMLTVQIASRWGQGLTPQQINLVMINSLIRELLITRSNENLSMIWRLEQLKDIRAKYKLDDQRRIMPDETTDQAATRHILETAKSHGIERSTLQELKLDELNAIQKSWTEGGIRGDFDMYVDAKLEDLINDTRRPEWVLKKFPNGPRIRLTQEDVDCLINVMEDIAVKNIKRFKEAVERTK